MTLKELRDLLTNEIEKDESAAELELGLINYCADHGKHVYFPDEIKKAYFYSEDGYTECIEEDIIHTVMIDEKGVVQRVYSHGDKKYILDKSYNHVYLEDSSIKLQKLKVNGFYLN